jgi:phosphoribosyl-AMP cyclohydrolase
MIDPKLLQSIGKMAAQSVQRNHPELDIRFLAISASDMKVAIVTKGDTSGRTARIFELPPLANDVDADAVKLLTDLLEGGVE